MARQPTISTESVAQDMLQSFFDRWQRLEDEKRAISEDLKGLFAEAKALGFDTKVMRAVFRDKVGDAEAKAEFEAIYELYASAIGMTIANARDTREADEQEQASLHNPQ